MSEGRPWNRPMLALASASAGLAVVSFVGLLVDDRTLDGVPIWVKPLKFGLSSLIYSLTWAWLCSLIDHRQKTVRKVSTVVVILLTLELTLITIQAARARKSHFNYATVLDAVLFDVMAASIIAVWCGVLVLTKLVARSDIQDKPKKLTVVLGAVLSLVGVGMGALMTIPSAAQFEALGHGGDVLGAHAVGAPDGGPGLPLVGWSTTGGDLRIPHFVGMHALQVLLLWHLALGLLARRWPSLHRARTRLVCTGAVGFAGLLAILTWQAYRGQPLTSPDAWTLAAFAALVTGIAAAAAVALRSARWREPQHLPGPAARGETRPGVRETRKEAQDPKYGDKHRYGNKRPSRVVSHNAAAARH